MSSSSGALQRLVIGHREPVGALRPRQLPGQAVEHPPAEALDVRADVVAVLERDAVERRDGIVRDDVHARAQRAEHALGRRYAKGGAGIVAGDGRHAALVARAGDEVVIVVSRDEAHGPDRAVDELEERPRALDGDMQRPEDKLEQVAVDQQLLRPSKLRLEALEGTRMVRELVA